MKEKLSLKEYVFLSSMLFGMFFGAGNLIFPIFVGSQTGRDLIPAILGFCVTSVGIPLLGVFAVIISGREGIDKFFGKVGKVFSTFFSIALYLSIGPLFAIPRSSTVAFTVSLAPHAPIEYFPVATTLYSFIFFNIVVFFSIKPKGLMIWIGKIFNPFFLVTVGIFVTSIFINPVYNLFSEGALPLSDNRTFLIGVLEGYNTLDVLSSLVFGVILMTSIQNLGIRDNKTATESAARVGLYAFIGIIFSYFVLAFAGANTAHLIHDKNNGGEALQIIAHHYFGKNGALLVGSIITFACLKTAISLTIASATAFERMCKGRCSYHFFAILFSLVSFGLSNFGLSGIIKYSIPFIVFLYPIAIILILLLLLDNLFHFHSYAVKFTLYLTTTFALVDSARVFSLKNISEIPLVQTPISRFLAETLNLALYVPFFNIRLSWIFFGVFGLFVSVISSLILRYKK